MLSDALASAVGKISSSGLHASSVKTLSDGMI
jgi:hypothetical protein